MDVKCLSFWTCLFFFFKQKTAYDVRISDWKTCALPISLTFEQGTDPDVAQVQVQNKLAQATRLLPQEVQQQGIRVTKAAKNYLLIVALYSEDEIGRASCRERVCQYV